MKELSNILDFGNFRHKINYKGFDHVSFELLSPVSVHFKPKITVTFYETIGSHKKRVNTTFLPISLVFVPKCAKRQKEKTLTFRRTFRNFDFSKRVIFEESATCAFSATRGIF